MKQPTERKRRSPKNTNAGDRKPFFPLTRKNGEPVTWASILGNKRVLQILSVIAAVFIWAVVSTGAAVQETKTIKNVPIEFDASGSLFQTYGLKVVVSDVDSVDVTVTGPRYVISSLNASDIKVTAITSDVTVAGTYDNINLRPGLQSGNGDVSVALKSTEPISATFDIYTSVTLPIEAEKEGTINVASGFVLGSVTVSPAEVTIDTPSAYVSRISRAVVKYSNKASKLTNGFISESAITLLDADGNEINIPSATLSTNTAEISVPVLKRKKVKTDVAVKPVNAPDGWSKYLDLTPSTIEIAGPADVIDAMTELTVGSIDVSTITETQKYTLTLSLGQNILDVNNVGFITVNIDYSKVKPKTISVSKIELDGIANIDLGKNSVTVVTQVLENVKVYASSGDIGNISGDNLKAVATLDPNNITAGQISLPVKIVSTDGTMVWAVGTYTILVDITAKG